MDYRIINKLNECINYCDSILNGTAGIRELQEFALSGEVLELYREGNTDLKKVISNMKNKLIQLKQIELHKIEENNL